MIRVAFLNIFTMVWIVRLSLLFQVIVPCPCGFSVFYFLKSLSKGYKFHSDSDSQAILNSIYNDNRDIISSTAIQGDVQKLVTDGFYRAI